MAEPATAAAPRRAAVADVCSQLKKALDARRLYEKGHVTLAQFDQVLGERLAHVLAGHEELALAVSALALAWDDKPVLQAEKREDSITAPLFFDGVQRLVFERGVTAEELAQLLAIWRQALDGALGTQHSFTTRFWEAHFSHLRLLSVETFTEGSAGEAEKNRREDHVQALMAELASEKLAGGTAGRAAGSRTMTVSREDLALLRLTAVNDLTAGELQRQDAARRAPVNGLDPGEELQLAIDVEASLQTAPERAIHAIAGAALLATEDEAARLWTVLASVLAAMSRAGQFADVARAIRVAGEHARSDTLRLDARFQTLARAVAQLGRPDVLEPAVAALDDEARAEDAQALLRLVPADAAGALLDLLPLPATAAGRRRLAGVLAALRPPGAAIAERATGAPPALVAELLWIADQLAPAEARPVRAAALSHADASVRRGALKALRREEVPAHREQLQHLLIAPEAELRHAALVLLVQAHDAQSVAAILQAYRSDALDEAEKKSVLFGLATMGGPVALHALRAELEAQGDPELRAACARALGGTGDRASIPALKKAAGGLLGSRVVKEAAREAVARIEAAAAARAAGTKDEGPGGGRGHGR